MRGAIGHRTSPSGAAAPAVRVEPEQYDISLTATDRNRYQTNLASLASNLASALTALGVRAQVLPNGVSTSGEDITTNPQQPLGRTRWQARVMVQEPTTQTLLHRALARAVWHSSTWDLFNVGGLRDGTWTPVEKDPGDGGASFVAGMTFGIEAAGHGQPGSTTPGGTAAEQSAAREINDLAQRVALLDGAGSPIVNAEVRRLQIAMGMLSDAANGRYNEDTKARMRYLGIAAPSPSFRAGTTAPAPNTTTSPVPTQSTPSSSSATILAGVGVVGLALWYFSRRR